MSLASLLVVNVLLSAATPQGPSFGGALIAAYHTVGGSARVLGPYTGTSAMVTAGFGANSPVIQAATKYFSQNPSPTALYVGRRALPFTQKMKFTPLTIQNGDVYSFNFGAVAGVGGTTITYTVSGSPTLATVCTALATAIQTAIGSGTATGASGTFVSWTSGTAGTLVEAQNQTPLFCDYLEDSADPGISTDLAAILVANPSDWYGLILDSNSANEVLAAAAWTEANGKLFVPASSDTKIANAASVLDCAYLVQSNSYARTGVQFLQNSNMSYEGAALLGKMLPYTPGNASFAYKQLAGVTVDTLPAGWDANVLTKNASVYTKLAGVPSTQLGRTGSGSWLDVTLFIDWLRSSIQIAVLQLLLSNPKISLDDLGLAQIQNTILGVLRQGERQKGLVAGSSVVNVPLVANISAVDRANRNVSGITFSARLAGAVNNLTITGTLTA